ncbi:MULTISPECIES: hypothetical protein [Rhizobium]|uniref:Uncharacterized protein n=1 Tax=Rhizobium phaseoli TaxID=396 RepID=A0A192TDT9_9HYPH|nr:MULTISPECIES: hypothetical protein [Rhizobium]ANL41062.1 hypothetical protein AMC88_CH02685 [Rhizobium phaseoli]ANL47297.1 hypothetical protein AMC87_CH02626 [Rhizobium phaseoli]ANL53797.1 hypothetical protein AMC86_CH02670 [Rhizobium phaseoli]ANL60050.1 hypothetical protein AMC85_CH02684 [Rhizobium phaseoli]ANL85443.1 hypothetical protein AMC81_CH02682 [Rhizobium phaseoli]
MDSQEQKASNGGFFRYFETPLDILLEADCDITFLLAIAVFAVLVILYACRALYRLGHWIWSVCRSGHVKKAVSRSADA